MDAQISAPARAETGVVAGYHAPGATPIVKDPSIVWSQNEADLFQADIGTFVIQDVRLLGDLTMALCAGRPTLFAIADARDAIHLAMLLESRTVVLSPYDRIYATRRFAWPGFAEHATVDPASWLAQQGRCCELPRAMAAFGAWTKPQFSKAARSGAAAAIANVSHFWRIVGDHGALAQTMMPAASMVRVGAGGPFDAFSPTLAFVDPSRSDELREEQFTQSTAVVAPFHLDMTRAIDCIIADLIDARDEPFHLHEVEVFGEWHGTTFGCIYGEYVR